MGEKSSQNLIDSINDSKKIPFDKLIYALGIKEVGISTAQSIATNYRDLSLLMSASKDELCLINDIGDVVAENIYDYFKNPINKKLINKLIKNGLLIEYYKPTKDMKLTGDTYVITGTFTNYSRQDIEKIIIDNGGKVTGSITKNTTALILGKKPGSKLVKAKKLNIKIIKQDELSKIL